MILKWLKFATFGVTLNMGRELETTGKRRDTF